MALKQDKNIAVSTLRDGTVMFSEETSLQLSLLKFIACIAVLYAHAYTPQYAFFAEAIDKLPWFRYPAAVISKYAAVTSVPVFFAVSGIIYFFKRYECSTGEFAIRKFRSIMQPYFLWNTLAISYIFIAQQLEFIRKFFPADKIISDFTIVNWLSAYLGWNNDWYPFLYPLWFLPCLFAAFVIVHACRKYFFSSNLPVWGVNVLNILCFSCTPLLRELDDWGPLLRILYSVAFFSLGKLFWQYKIFLEQPLVMPISGLAFLGMVLMAFRNPLPWVTWLVPILYSGVIFVLSFTGKFVKRYRKLDKYILFLAGFSFMVYLTHEFALTALLTLLYPCLPLDTGVYFAVYLLLPLLLAAALITGGWWLKKYLPKIYGFLFSGR